MQGSPNALVTVVMFQDFQCPFCQRSVATVEQLRQEFPQDVRVVFKHNPLPFHTNAMAAAQLAYVARLEHYCRLAPYNWFNFYDFWKS